MPLKDADSIRVTITLDCAVYQKIKRASRQMGLRPATWIAMMATSKANNMEVNLSRNGDIVQTPLPQDELER